MRYANRLLSGGGRGGGPRLRSDKRKIALPSAMVDVEASRIGGRGGIRTHGGFPHARFRVECLKPDSATLPFTREENAQRPTSKAQCKRPPELEVERSALDVERFLQRVAASTRLADRIFRLTTQKCYN